MGAFTLLSFLSLFSSILAAPGRNQNKHLTATAIVNTPDNKSSAFQCWQINTPFDVATLDGTAAGAMNLALADVSKVNYVVRPPHEEYGLHNAPNAQIVVYLSGLINITVPTKPEQQSLILGGGHGLFFAMDTEGEGHYATYPSDEQTVGLMIPLKDGKAPEHVVLDDKPCGTTSSII
ncbi:uncharacterized protein ACHE_60842A [Aspergillus chevalieri]|uniref:Small secreted protein n=1 Tax=Aspergillus chevalieri TaxID=182096 RepID=A0A7R7VUC7_ASPCH|nr:uncharacterized protein ACHE_60842A [Aspergillus chevalieri]BCR90956.1 hypothetical protein ACHE_60842A [Aspergillus chevalieri]